MRNPEAKSKTSTELREYLKFMINPNYKDENLMALFIWGNPGIGKTQMIDDICNSYGVKYANFKLAQENPVTVVGLFAINNQEKITERYFNERINELIEEDKKGNITVLFFDELIQGVNTIPAIWELVNEKRLGKYKFKHLRIIAASNYIEQYVALLDKAFWSRFMHINLEPDLFEVAAYITNHSKQNQVPLFLMQNPSRMYDDSKETFIINPRKWHYVQKMIDIGEKDLLLKFADAYHPYVEEFANNLQLLEKVKSYKELIDNPELILKVKESKDPLDRYSYYNFILNLNATSLKAYFKETIKAIQYLINQSIAIKSEIQLRFNIEDFKDLVMAVNSVKKNYPNEAKVFYDIINSKMEV